MFKDYYYKGYRYYYCPHYKKWLIDTNEELIYMDNKEQVKDYIDYLVEREEKENEETK